MPPMNPLALFIAALVGAAKPKPQRMRFCRAAQDDKISAAQHKRDRRNAKRARDAANGGTHA